MNFLNLLTDSPVLAGVFLLSMVIAITFHEFSHAWMADRLGDETPALMGRLTLNPAAHLDPIGSIFFLIFGFGWGKPVVYNPMRLQRKIDELWVALAGPASNLLLALILNAAVTGLVAAHISFINVDFLRLAAQINIYLGAFNLLPLPPLDGSSIVAYFYPAYRSITGSQIGLLIVLLLVFASVGQTSLLMYIMTPILRAFTSLGTLFGLIG